VPTELVCCPARMLRPWDGDSGDLLVNFRRRGTWRTAQIVGVRLKGFRAQENRGIQRDTPELGPDGEVRRVSGRDAASVTTTILLNAKLILVEFTGLNDREREICDMWVQEPGSDRALPFGPLLLERKVVLPGDTIGTRD
jgi:hypothetical protein